MVPFRVSLAIAIDRATRGEPPAVAPRPNVTEPGGALRVEKRILEQTIHEVYWATMSREVYDGPQENKRNLDARLTALQVRLAEVDRQLAQSATATPSARA